MPTRTTTIIARYTPTLPAITQARFPTQEVVLTSGTALVAMMFGLGNSVREVAIQPVS